MKRLIAFSILALVKIISHCFFKGHFTWINETPEKPWDNVRLIALLNHTSLYEPVYIQALSFSFLWKLADKVNVPGADVTLNRPVVGLLWKLMLPNIASVTRKRDRSWVSYLNSIKPDSVILIAPEGRMKRLNGLDKNGRPMTVQGGIADIIEVLDEGSLVLCFSGGLHHIQAPGQHFPRLFQPIFMNMMYLDIREYKKSFADYSPRERKLKITQDFQQRLETHCPKNPLT